MSFTAAGEADVEKLYDDIDSLGYKVVREEEEEEEEEASAHHDPGDYSAWMLPVCLALTIPLLLHMWLRWPLLHQPLFQAILATPVFLIGWMKFGQSAVRSIGHWLPNMNVLILLGATAAYLYSTIGWLFTNAAHQYLFFETGATIITLVMAGAWLEHRTVKSTTAAIDALIKLQPQKARLIMTDSIGKESIVEVEQKHVRSGDAVLVVNGEAAPVDGEIYWGEAAIDESMITGEALPARKAAGDKVVGGTLLTDGSIKLRATTVGKASVLAGIVRAVREAQASRSPLQQLADRISAVFVPAVLGISILTFLGNHYLAHLPFEVALMRAIAVLVISCPCAMGLATPAATAVGLGRAAGRGILIKGSDTLQRLAEVQQIVFDKTGTLTTGKMKVAELFVQAAFMQEEVKRIIVALEQHSSHPIAASLLREWAAVAPAPLTGIKEWRGKGMTGTDDSGTEWKLGSAAWLGQSGCEEGHLMLLKGSTPAATLKLRDALRSDAADAILQLKGQGYKIILLSGDRPEVVKALGAELGVDEVYGGQSPEAKQQKIRELMQAAPTAMVGDGINDAPALALASVGISLSEASGIAVQSAQVVLSGGRLAAVGEALRLGALTVRTIKQNLFWAFIYNVLAIPVAALGYLSPTWGAGLMAVSDVVLVLNSLRLRYRGL